MQAVDVDDVDAQTLQAFVASQFHIVGVSAGESFRHTAAQSHVAELGGEQHLVAPALDRLRNQ